MKTHQTAADPSVASRMFSVALMLIATFVLPCLALGWLILKAVSLLS